MTGKISGAKTTILYISSFASLHGGGQRSLLVLLRTLDRNCFTPWVLVPESGELEHACNDLGIQVEILSFPRIRSGNLRSIVGAVRRLRSLVRTTGARIIHTDAPRQTWYALAARRSPGTKVVFHARVSDRIAVEDWLLAHLADAIVCVSESVRRRFSTASRAKVGVVYNSAAPEFFQQPVTAIATGPLRIGYFGRLHPRKGLPVLIAAVNKLGDCVTCVIQGSGERDYEQQLRQGAGKNITFFPYAPDIVREMAAVDVVVLPDIEGEGFSRLLIEALAMGRAVLASDTPENREVLGEALKDGLFPRGDAAALAQRLNVLADRNQLARLAQLGRQRAQGLFQAAPNTQQIEKIYRGLLGPAAKEMHA